MDRFNVGVDETGLSIGKDIVRAIDDLTCTLEKVHVTLVELQKVASMHDSYDTADRMVKDEKDSNRGRH